MQMAPALKNLPAMQEAQVRSLGQEDPLEEEMATSLVFLPGNPTDRRVWRATVHGLTESCT